MKKRFFIISLFWAYVKYIIDICPKTAYTVRKGFPKGEFYAKTYEMQKSLPLSTNIRVFAR